MGFLDLPAPILSYLNDLLRPLAPLWLLLVLWALLGSALSMGLYRLVSPQNALSRIRRESASLRQELNRYDGEFSGIRPLAGRLLGLALKQVGLTLGPALLGALPVILLLVWASNTFAFRLPASGSVALGIHPPTTAVSRVSAGRRLKDGSWLVHWPSLKGSLEVQGAAGRSIATINPRARVPLLQHKKWWNLFLGNPAGYLARGSKMEKITLGFKAIEYLPWGPAWLRGWETVFLGALLIFSLAIKIIFRIH